MNKIVSLGYCDGISCIQPALINAGITDYLHISVEYDEKARMVTKKNFPNTIFLNDVRTVDIDSLPKINFFSSGFSCKDVSQAGTKKGFKTKSGIIVPTAKDYLYLKGIGSKFTQTCETFWESIIALKRLQELNPNLIYIFENVKMKQEDEDFVSDIIGHSPFKANSKYFLGQNRDRRYWTNLQVDKFDEIIKPLSLIIPEAITGSGYRRKDHPNGELEYNHFTKRKDGIANCLTTFKAHKKNYGTRFYATVNNPATPLTISHMEQLQGLPIGYTDVPGITEDDRIRMLGNCWTVSVISHILKNIKY